MRVYNCGLCPRHCAVNRIKGETGYCRAGTSVKLALAALHFGEEPPISGVGGSGAMFFSNCNLGCVFCQNYQISSESYGREISAEDCAGIMLKLQEAGAENINLVTGTPQIYALVPALRYAKQHGLKLPVYWNSSGYETETAVELIDEFIDFYLPDLKTLNKKYARAWFAGEDYGETAARSILKMLSLKPNKTIIRHLIMPGFLDSTREVLEWFVKNAAGRAELSLMTQYTPVKNEIVSNSTPKRFVSQDEYKTVLNWLFEFEIEDGYFQELMPDSGWLPDFSRENPFESKLSKTIWHS
ncbi:MAG: radical SAM protein [Termitinemataceae bacterium]|nr:MAG: radical SAM protein [Termitinemataceae bacterium]